MPYNLTKLSSIKFFKQNEKEFDSQSNYHTDAIDQNSKELPHLVFNHIVNNLAQQQLHKSPVDNILKGVKNYNCHLVIVSGALSFNLP